MLVVSSVSSVGDDGSSGILVLPVEIEKIPHPAKSRCWNRISIKDNAAPLTSFWFLASNRPRPSSFESTWEVESEIYSDEFSVCMGAVNRLFRRCRMGRTGRRFYGPISIIGRSGDAL